LLEIGYSISTYRQRRRHMIFLKHSVYVKKLRTYLITSVENTASYFHQGLQLWKKGAAYVLCQLHSVPQTTWSVIC